MVRSVVEFSHLLSQYSKVKIPHVPAWSREDGPILYLDRCLSTAGQNVVFVQKPAEQKERARA